jgi:steroid delta-isomerase-like uncharacterized protein
MSEPNKAIILHLMEECFNQHNVDIHSELYSKDFVHHTSAFGDLRRAEHRELLASTFAAFPDSHWTVIDQIAERDKVVTRWTFTGTHRGTFMGIAPTGKQLVFTGISIDRLIDATIVEEWEEWDTLGRMQQLGIVPVETSVGDMVAP